jgi:hypothetical protein
MYKTFADTEVAIKHLQDAGFQLKLLSVAGKDDGTDKHMASCYNTGHGLKYHAKSDSSWARMRDLLSGWGFFWSLDGGPVHVVGPLVQAIVAVQEGTGSIDGMNEFGTALFGFGIPTDSIVAYENALKNHQFLLCARGPLAELDRAHSILLETEPTNGTVHHDAANCGETPDMTGNKKPCARFDSTHK